MNQGQNETNFPCSNQQEFKRSQKTNFLLYIILALIIIIIGILIGVVAFSNKKDKTVKDTTTSSTPDKQNLLTEENFKKVENQYLDSRNLFNIDELYMLSERGTIVNGKVKKGNFAEGDIISFIDRFGKKRKAVISSIEQFNSLMEDEDVMGLMLSAIEKEDLKLASMVFKNETYNGINISFYYDKAELEEIEKYFNSVTKLDIVINGVAESAEIINYYDGEETQCMDLYLILEDNNTYAINDSVNIKALNKIAKIDKLLK